jgi:hypothetical protein
MNVVDFYAGDWFRTINKWAIHETVAQKYQKEVDHLLRATAESYHKEYYKSINEFELKLIKYIQKEMAWSLYKQNLNWELLFSVVTVHLWWWPFLRDFGWLIVVICLWFLCGQ